MCINAEKTSPLHPECFTIIQLKSESDWQIHRVGWWAALTPSKNSIWGEGGFSTPFLREGNHSTPSLMGVDRAPLMRNKVFFAFIACLFEKFTLFCLGKRHLRGTTLGLWDTVHIILVRLHLLDCWVTKAKGGGGGILLSKRKLSKRIFQAIVCTALLTWWYP